MTTDRESNGMPAAEMPPESEYDTLTDVQMLLEIGYDEEFVETFKEEVGDHF